MTAISIIIIINSQQFVANNKQQTTNNKQQTTNNKQQTTNNKQQWDERALNVEEVPRILMIEPLGRHARLSIVVFPTDPRGGIKYKQEDRIRVSNCLQV
jgi:hypothetical protein